MMVTPLRDFQGQSVNYLLGLTNILGTFRVGGKGGGWRKLCGTIEG